MDVTVSSNSERVKVPASIRARAGRSAIRFEVTATEDASQESVLIEAHAGSEHAQVGLLMLSSGSLHLNVPHSLTSTPGLPVRFTAVRREHNELADRLVNEALDAAT